MTSVKRGFVTVGNVSVHTPVPALSLRPSVWSANEESGSTVSDERHAGSELGHTRRLTLKHSVSSFYEFFRIPSALTPGTASVIGKETYTSSRSASTVYQNKRGRALGDSRV